MDDNPWIDDCFNYKKMFGVEFLAYLDLTKTSLCFKKNTNIACINMVCFSNLTALKEVHSFVSPNVFPL